jgi:hypothetical protein
MMKSITLYILWGKYYNPVLDAYTEKPLGYYLTAEHAERMCDVLNRTKTDGSTYYVKVDTAFE